jgi:heat shock protein HtpX
MVVFPPPVVDEDLCLLQAGEDLAVSRQREWLADAHAASVTGRPLALAHALEKLASAPVVLANGRRMAQALCIAGERPSGSLWRDLFSSHPPVGHRIRRLYAFAGAQPPVLPRRYLWH